MNKILSKLILLLILFLFQYSLFSTEIPEIILGMDDDSIMIGKSIQIFEDKSGDLSIDDILAPDFNGSFVNSQMYINNFGYTDSSIWVRFNISKSRNLKKETPWVILNKYANIHFADLYQVDENKKIIRAKSTGTMRPIESRDHLYNKLVFFAYIPPAGKTNLIYLKFKGKASLTINLSIMSMSEFMRLSSWKTLITGIFVGILLIMAGYNLFLFFSIKDSIHLYFSLMIAGLLLFYLSFSGHANIYFWPNKLWFTFHSALLSGGILIILFLKFSDSFLNCKKHSMFWHRIFNIIIIALSIFITLTIITGSRSFSRIIKFLSLFAFLAIFIALFKVNRKLDANAFYYSLAYFVLSVTGIFFLLEKISFLPSFDIVEFGLQTGSIIFIFLISLSLAERIKILKIAKEKSDLDLKDSRKRFRSLVESSYDIIWETDNKGNFSYLSPNVEDILGYKREDIIGENLNSIFNAEHNKVKENPFEDHNSKNEPVIGFINTIEDSHKKNMTFETNALPFFNDKGEFQGYRGINRDITERRRAEKIQEIIFNISNSVNTTLNMNEFYKIIHSELNKLVDATNFFVGIYDKESDTISLPYLKDEKDRLEKISAEGTISSIVIKENRSMLLRPEDITKLEDEGKIGIVGTPCKVWLGVPLKVDTNIIGLLVLQSYTDQNAYSKSDLKLMEFISGQIAVSITKKQVEERIHILAQSVEQSPALVMITDLNANIEYVNSKFVETTGYSLEDVIGSNPGVLKSGKIPKKIYEELWKRLNNGKEWRGEFHNKKKNGDFYWELAFITPIKNELGKISHYLAIKEDITERKEHELQLIQSQKMESFGTLAGGISHDFNNILTVINGYSDLALMRLKKTDPLYKEISTIKKAGRRGEKLTRQIMAFSRKQIFHPLIININDVIKDLESTLMSLIEEDFKITFKLNQDIPLIKADPSQIEQILINLLVNARDAINLKTQRAGEKLITVETGIQFIDESFTKKNIGSTLGPHIYISVSDNGIGMTEDVLQNIFEPFFTTKVRGKGTGMGLATVYGIVKQNNSSIFIYSEPGEGSTFKIFWPTTNEKLSETDTKELGESDLYGNEKILFVEDDKHVKDFAVAALNDFGYEVHSSINGKHALEYIKQKNIKFDMLITDLVMPDMNGKELSENVLKLFPDIKILFTSGYTDNHLVSSGELQEDVNFLAKPYAAKSLLTFVRKILNPG